MKETEDELEAFRRQWKEEVSKKPSSSERHKSQASSQSQAVSSTSGKGKSRAPPTYTRPVHDAEDTDFGPHEFHDLPNKEDYLKLENEATRHKATEGQKEPETALEHYEKAVEQEVGGRLGDSVSLYRKAFRLDDRVHEQYKRKHFPPSTAHKKVTGAATAAAPTTESSKRPQESDASQAPPNERGPVSMQQLMQEFQQMDIVPAPPETDLSDPPPCPIAHLPGEILVAMLSSIAQEDPGLLSRLAQVCRRFAYLVTTENSMWRQICLSDRYGFSAMHYRYVVDLKGSPLWSLNPTISEHGPPPRTPLIDMTPSLYKTHRQQFRHRPRIRFNGAYISTVNYIRQGQAGQSRYTWNNPVHIVTYYRYLRFFRDGSAISLLTTAEPADVVHHLSRENVGVNHSSGLPQVVMKDALPARWRLSGPASAGTEDAFDGEMHDGLSMGPGQYAREPQSDWSILGDNIEKEGDVHVETEGVIPKYMYKMQFSFGHAGRREGPRNNKLNWKGFWSYNRLTDDWGEFALKNDKPFYFSRVKSYSTGR